MAELREIPRGSYQSLDQTERDTLSPCSTTFLAPAPPPASAERKRTTWEKLGTYNIWILTLGAMALLLAMSFLTFLWFTSTHEIHGGTLPPLWKLIAGRTWVSRVITLSAIFIRIATVAQLCVFAAIMAAVILERVGASNQDFPLLSMIRCANSGPQALIWNVLHTMKTGSQIGYSLIIVLTILNAIALQFTSTILLADLGSVDVVMNYNKEGEIYYDLGSSTMIGHNIDNTYSVDFWRSGPQIYPRFAEYFDTETGTSSIGPSSGPNFTDTGKVYRGFLPFTSEQRNTLRAYHGPMEVVDARVVCIKPQLSDLTMSTDGSETYIFGKFDIENVYPSAITAKPIVEDSGKSVRQNFNCSAPTLAAYKMDSGPWNASICNLGISFGRLLNSIIPEDPTSGLFMGETFAQVFFNATHVNNGGYAVTPGNDVQLKQMDSSLDAWAKFGNEDMTFDLSLCYANPLPNSYLLSAYAAENSQDNVAFWDNSTGIPTFNTYWVERSLDVLAPDSDQGDRGLLTLISPVDWNASRTYYVFNSEAGSANYVLDSLVGKTNESIGATHQLALADSYQATHRIHIDLIMKFIRRTNNPALTLQAHWTILMQMAYYDVAGLFDFHAPATYGMAESVIIPTRWKSFNAIMALVALHFALLALALFLFITRTKFSLLGNAWQAVSQVMSSDTATVVHHSAMATDDEVKKTAMEHDIDTKTMVIATSTKTGRIEATSVMRRK